MKKSGTGARGAWRKAPSQVPLEGDDESGELEQTGKVNKETPASSTSTGGQKSSSVPASANVWGRGRVLNIDRDGSKGDTPTVSSLGTKPTAPTVAKVPAVTSAPESRKPTAPASAPQKRSSNRKTSSGWGTKGGQLQRAKRDSKPNPDLVENQKEIQDFVLSRPSVDGVAQTKQGKLGQQVELLTNYYTMNTMTDFNLFHYHVEFKPDDERTDIRKKLVKIHESTLGAFIFDGQALYSPSRLGIQYLYSMNAITKKKTQISLKLVAEITPIDPVFLQVYNIIFRNIMMSLNLEVMGRFYYDPKAKVVVPNKMVEMWPGFITSVRNHENQIMANIEVNHKVVRSDSVLDYIENVRKSTPPGKDYKKTIFKELLNSIIVTTYNKKNYKVDDIKWDITPKGEFKMKGENMSYIDYFKQHYGWTIKNTTQPMLVSLPKKRDYHRGSNQPIYLVPELCQMTGLSDQMRTDPILMQDLARHLIMDPSERVRRANAFVERWYATPSVVEELKRWNIQLSKEPKKCQGRVLDLEQLVVGPKSKGKSQGGPVKVIQEKPGEFANIFKQSSMLSTVRLSNWVLILPPNNDKLGAQMLETLRNQGRSMGFVIDEPTKFTMRDTRPASYASTIEGIYSQKKMSTQLFVVILPSNFPDTYSAIKKKTYCELGVPCQCIIARTLQTKNLISVTNRVAIQINAKLGGEPWTVDIPLRDIMIVGYDVFHSPNKRMASVGALVASTSPTLGKYFSATHFHKNKNELSSNLCSSMTNALYSYAQRNGGRPPARIILYRDGVGDGQLTYIFNTELQQIKEAIRGFYGHGTHAMPKFSFIVVTKRIHTRIFLPPTNMSAKRAQNPPPGTVVDDVITLPERYDFFLVSQPANIQGTISPTSYNVLYDEQGLDPDKMQRLTLKLCHLYFNFTGTIAVPAPCQFAHKLAYLTGTSLNNPTHRALQNTLYFL